MQFKVTQHVQIYGRWVFPPLSMGFLVTQRLTTQIYSLVYEMRSDFQSAITFYQQARFALGILSNSNPENKNAFTGVTVNLARSLCMVRVLWLHKHTRSLTLVHAVF